MTFALLVLAFICSTDRPETLKAVPFMFCLMLGAMLTKGLLKTSGGYLTLRQWGAVATGVVLLAVPWYVTRGKPFRLKPHKRRQLW